MDATVTQLDGYRFLYVLPLAEDRLLIEDTRYSDGPALDQAELARDIAAYAAQQGWTIVETVREENGVLPIALGRRHRRLLGQGAGPAPNAACAPPSSTRPPAIPRPTPPARPRPSQPCRPHHRRRAGRPDPPVQDRLERAGLLPAAQPHAVPGGGARPALSGAGAVLSPAPAADRTLLRRPGQLRRTSCASWRQAAGADRRGDGLPLRTPLLAERAAAHDPRRRHRGRVRRAWRWPSACRAPASRPPSSRRATSRAAAPTSGMTRASPSTPARR